MTNLVSVSAWFSRHQWVVFGIQMNRQGISGSSEWLHGRQACFETLLDYLTIWLSTTPPGSLTKLRGAKPPGVPFVTDCLGKVRQGWVQFMHESVPVSIFRKGNVRDRGANWRGQTTILPLLTHDCEVIHQLQLSCLRWSPKWSNHKEVTDKVACLAETIGNIAELVANRSCWRVQA